MGQACLGVARPAELWAAKELDLNGGSFLAFGRTPLEHPAVTNKYPLQAHQNARKCPLCRHWRSISCRAMPLLPPLRTFPKWDPAFCGGVASNSGQVSPGACGEKIPGGRETRSSDTAGGDQSAGRLRWQSGGCVVLCCQKHSRAPLRALLLDTAFSTRGPSQICPLSSQALPVLRGAKLGV